MKYNGTNLNEVLEAHEKWLKGTPGGSQANFAGKKLSGADLSGRDLSGAILCYADFSGANFTGAKLSGTNFAWTDLSGANFSGAVFNGATCFEHVVLSPKIKIDHPLACPETGSFIGYKASREGYIVELLIPEDAKRSSSTGKKCRCDKAKVISIQKISSNRNLDGNSARINKAHSCYQESFVYCVGETVSVPDFDECRWHECASGIHFFMDRKDAVNYFLNWLLY